MADHLADFPLLEYQPLQTQFPDEDILFAMENSKGRILKMNYSGICTSMAQLIEGAEASVLS